MQSPVSHSSDCSLLLLTWQGRTAAWCIHLSDAVCNQPKALCLPYVCPGVLTSWSFGCRGPAGSELDSPSVAESGRLEGLSRPPGPRAAQGRVLLQLCLATA